MVGVPTDGNLWTLLTLEVSLFEDTLFDQRIIEN
jgi:hypothetical protein